MAEKPTRALRADAARNRAKLLDVAYRVFAEQGLSVPIDEIARQAGVGAGTVYRHFPTKQALYQAIAEARFNSLIERAERLLDSEDPGAAFFGYFSSLVDEGGADKGLAEALAGLGIELEQLVPGAEQRFKDVLGRLLTRAQQSGAVRPDVTVMDVKALLVGCHAMDRQQDESDAARRIVAVIRDGLSWRVP
ncbi:MAG TPA: helix-turn-helix domain-containing protein [Micromonosporaceae bacterium]|jgi:AcrR family transcriptional regulator|nr:helix-turn-helix domain-containing protein [Micromonosporaceae bacterium]